jgi:hypothetical protein
MLAQTNAKNDYAYRDTIGDQELEAVTVSAARRANVTKTEMSVAKLDRKTIKKIPALMGEVDIIKAIMLLPGVQPASEGTSSFSVRGGSPDQNLILFDYATVYNASHLMGFFSVFNNDVIEDVKLYKGDIPANYGGRLSSLLNVNTKNGDPLKFNANGGIGLISSRLEVDGPIIDNKLSFVAAGRRTYADLFLPLAPDEYAGVRNSILHFYDLNGKLTYRPTKRDRITLSGYRGSDAFGMEIANMNFSNTTYGLTWTHSYSDDLFSSVSVLGSGYDYRMEMDMTTIYAGWHSAINDIGLRADFTYLYGDNATLHWGASSVWHTVEPCDAWLIMDMLPSTSDLTGDETQSTGATRYPITMETSYALESSVYVMNEHKLGSRLTIKYGLRATLFNNVGPVDELVMYGADYKQLSKTESYTSGNFYNHYWGIEPRAGAVFLLDNDNSLKAAYSRTMQFMHLISNATAGSPLDVWMPSSPNIKPQSAHQGSMGYFQNLMGDALELSGEVFYKYLDNIVDYKDHARILGNNRLEGEVRNGIGQSYGFEFMARKNTGAFTGWVSYTYAHSLRRVETVNNDEWYQAPSDRPHNLNIVASYDITKTLNISANWTYATGMPTTFPIGRYDAGGTIVPIYGKRNTDRFEDYHRLDVALTVQLRKHKRYSHELNISAYNAYNRHNTWYIQFAEDPDNKGATKATKVYLFGVVPSITYNFKW